MKDSEIYRKAAKLVDSGNQVQSCCGIWSAQGDYDCDDMVDEYRFMFSEANNSPSAFWLNYGSASDWTPEERKEWRVLALLFMAAICKAEGC